MRVMQELALGLKLLWRDHRAGELALIVASIVIAVGSVTTVGFFTDRVHHALGRQANQLLGADLVIASDKPVAPEIAGEARGRGLAMTTIVRFPSMVMQGERNLLSSVKAVGSGYPLRGELKIASELYGPDRRAGTVPEPGTAWVDERLYTQLGLKLGERVELGRASFTVTAILTQEPDVAIGFFNGAPRILINEADLAKTALIQPGSRVGHRFLVAGGAAAVEDFRAWAATRLRPGQRLEGLRDARPEMRAALERAEKYLSLAALVTVVLAAAAIGLAARRFLQRHLDACAMMRCLGARQGMLLRLYAVHLLALGVIASGVGCLIGIGAQAVLAQWLGSLVAVELPAPGARPAIHGLLTGLALLLGFALPPLVALRHVPTLRVMRRELGAPPPAGLATYAAGYAVIVALIVWKAEGLRLAAIVLGGFTGAMLAAAAFTWLMIRAAGRVTAGGLTWRYGIANLRRRALGSILQVVALGVGIMALLVLTLVRHDLLNMWRTTLPPDAPNRFIVNIQPDQVEPLRAFFAKHGVREPPLFPMIRGRLVQINDRRVSSADYHDERARRLIDREFNLSWAERVRADNRVSAGRWWPAGKAPPQFSVEEGLAEALGIAPGDTLTFDIAGSPVSARVTNLRKVDWDTFNVNFFVIAPPGMLESYPASFVTSFYLPSGNAAMLAELVRAFPNFVLIDVAQIIGQIQKMMDQVARAVQFIFLFTLLAGLAVLYAAIAATQDERLYQATVMRTLGASRSQLRRAIVAEFAVLGALAGLLAAAGATALGYFVATQLLHLAYTFNPGIWVIGALAGSVGIAAAGYARTRAVLNVAPLKALRDIV